MAQCNRIPEQNARKQTDVPLSCYNTHSTPFADFTSYSVLGTEFAFCSLSPCVVFNILIIAISIVSLCTVNLSCCFTFVPSLSFAWSYSRFLQFGNSLHQRQSGQPVGRVQGGPMSALLCCSQLSGRGVRVRRGGPKHHAMTPEPTQQHARFAQNPSTPAEGQLEPHLGQTLSHGYYMRDSIRRQPHNRCHKKATEWISFKLPLEEPGVLCSDSCFSLNDSVGLILLSCWFRLIGMFLCLPYRSCN